MAAKFCTCVLVPREFWLVCRERQCEARVFEEEQKKLFVRAEKTNGRMVQTAALQAEKPG